MHLKHPRKTTLKRSGSGKGSGFHSTKSTEERAVDLYRTHVLEPDDIKISDQRLRPGVGADLIGDDRVFRELKARTGSAEDLIKLTSFEYERAGQEHSEYELVIVEHVWDEPTITIIKDPLHRLKYHPVGDIEIEGWEKLDPKPRTIHLKKGKK